MFPGNNIVKQNSPKTTVTFLPTRAPHTQSPQHLPALHQQPTTELRPLTRPSYRTSTHAFTSTRSLSLSIALSLPSSLWSWLPFILLTASGSRYTGEEKREGKAKPLTFLSGPPWPQKQPMRSTALEERERERERERAGEIGWLMLN